MHSKSTLDSALPRTGATRKLSEDEKKALGLAEKAEHHIGRKSEFLQKEARRKAENG
jgi:hypothetical protein